MKTERRKFIMLSARYEANCSTVKLAQKKKRRDYAKIGCSGKSAGVADNKTARSVLKTGRALSIATPKGDCLFSVCPTAYWPRIRAER